jgi:hypothetical protein
MADELRRDVEQFLYRKPACWTSLLLGAVTKLSNFAILSTVALGAGTFGRWLARRPALRA